MVHNNSTKNFDLLEAYKSVYNEQPCTLDKELVDPPADPQGEMGSYGPKGSPKKPHGGDHARITGESEPKRKGRYRAAYEEYKKELTSHYAEKFNEWVQSLSDEGYDITKWEHEELIETYIQENNLWDSADIINEITSHLDEKTRYAKETGINFRKQKPQPEGGSARDDKAFQHVSGLMRTMSGGRPAGQRPKVKGQKPPTAGKYGSERESPAQIVAKRRAAAKRSQDLQNDTRGT